MLKIGFRVDASNHIGVGHLMEVAAIIRALRRKIKFKPIVLTATSRVVSAGLRAGGAIELTRITDNRNEAEDARQTVAGLRRHGCENLVTDLMTRSSAYYRYIGKRVPHLCVIHDDAKHRETRATAVINFSLTQNSAFYQGKRGRYYLGPRFMPINEAILKYPRRPKTGAVKNIFINQGGGDPFGLTAKTLRALKPLNLKQQVNIVVGGVLKPHHFQELQTMERHSDTNLHFFYNIPHGQMLKMISHADLAVSAPGNALYELAYFKVPTIVISHHLRHDKIARAFKRNQSIINLGIGRKITTQKITNAVKMLLADKTKRAALSRRVGRLVDGRGLQRVVNIILNTIKSAYGRI